MSICLYLNMYEHICISMNRTYVPTYEDYEPTNVQDEHIQILITYKYHSLRLSFNNTNNLTLNLTLICTSIHTAHTL